VDDPAREAPRSRTFEISPTGPIFGKKMPHPGGVEAEIEAGILEREGILATEFHQLMPRLHLEGGRRPFRVRLEDVKLHFEGRDLLLEFFLPKGSYATTFLRELMKNDVVPDAFYAGGEEAKHRLWRPRLDRGEPGLDRGEPGLDRGEPGPDRGETGPDRGEPVLDRGQSGPAA
jgi:hypothetical protein